MSSKVWQNLQSCLDLQRPRGGAVELKDSLYVHPLCKRSLSDRSLELCTENLGCETGSLCFSSSDDDYEDDKDSTRRVRSLSPVGFKPRPARSGRDSTGTFCSNNIARKYPPPLTSISGHDSIRVKPHREGGRLVLKAVTIPSSQLYLYAERSDGRLTLRFLNSPLKSDEEYADDEEENAKEIGEENVDEEEEGVYLGSEDVIDVNNDNIDEDGMGVPEKFQRPSRCKESEPGYKGLMTWGETFWVASS